MKATCPKCGKALHVWNWKQNCPYCGVNIVGYDLQARLLRDADQAELEFAQIQPYFDRAKASYVGSKAAIARIVCHALPIGSLFLPLFRHTGLSMRSNVIHLIKMIKQHFSDAPASGLSSVPRADAACVVLLALCVLMILVHLGMIAGSCSAKGRRRLFTLDALLLATAAAGLWCMHLSFAGTPFAVGIGTIALCASVVLLVVFDVILAHVGIPVQYKTCYIRGIPADEFLQAQAAETTV